MPQSQSPVNSFAFAYNPKVQLTPGVTKEDLRSVLLRSRLTFKKEFGIENLIKRVQEGYTHQPAICENWKKETFLQAQFIVIDLDQWDKAKKAPIPTAIALDTLISFPFFQESLCFIQKSISYREEAQNAHLYFILDNPVTSLSDLSLISQALSDKLKELTGCQGFDGCSVNNPCQIIFASNYEPYILNLENRLDTSQFLAIAKEKEYKVSQSLESPQNNLNFKLSQPSQKVENPPESQKEEVSITQQVLNHLYKYLFVEKLNSDPTLLYSLHEGNLVWDTSRRPESENEVLRATCNLNPFSETNNSGQSFMVIYEREKLPRCWDKSGSLNRIKQSGHSTSHASFLDYYFLVKKSQGFYADIDFENGSLPKSFFKVLVKDICEEFDLPSFEFKNQNEWIYFKDLSTLVCDSFSKYFHYIGKNHFQFFDNDRKIWVSCDTSQPVIGELRKFLSDNYSDVKVYKKLTKDGEPLPMPLKDREFLEHTFWELSTHKSSYRLKPPLEVLHYIPCQNGVYNLSTRELEENNGQAYNSYLFPWKYTGHFNPDKVELFKEYLQYFTEDEDKGNLLFYWLLLNIRREAFASMKIVGLIGASGKGKTFYLNVIAYALNGSPYTSSSDLSGYATKGNTEDFMSGYSHASCQLENKSAILFEEMTGGKNGDHKSLEFLKGISGSKENRFLPINPKGQKGRQIFLNSAITFDCEKFPNLKSPDIGYLRRFAIVEIKNTSPVNMEYYSKISPLLKDAYEDLFNYAMTLSTEKLTSQFLSLADLEVFRLAAKTVRENSDPLLDFVKEYVIISNDPENKISESALYDLLTKVNIKGKYISETVKKAYFINSIQEKLEDRGYELSWKGERLSKDTVWKCPYIKKASRGGFTGLHLTPEGLDLLGCLDLLTEAQKLETEARSVSGDY